MRKFIVILCAMFAFNYAAHSSHDDLPSNGFGSPPRIQTVFYDKSNTPGSKDPEYPWYNPRFESGFQPEQKKLLFVRRPGDYLMDGGFIEIIPNKRGQEQCVANLVFVTDAYKTREELERYIRTNKENYSDFIFSSQQDKTSRDFFAYVSNSVGMTSYSSANLAAQAFKDEYDLEVLGRSDSKDSHSLASTDSASTLSADLSQMQQSPVDGVGDDISPSKKARRTSDGAKAVRNDSLSGSGSMATTVSTGTSVKLSAQQGKKIVITGQKRQRKQIAGQTSLARFGFR